MPQLDTVTFLSQIFWLVIIFGFFYLIVLTHILPAISRILKVRKKKLEHNKNAMYALGDEKGDTLTGYDKILSQGLEVSRNSLAKSSQLGDAWVSSSLKDINKEGSMLNSNTSYLNAFGSLIGRKHAIAKFYKKN
jgi:F-type H+-transporting ATPase subunit b